MLQDQAAHKNKTQSGGQRGLRKRYTRDGKQSCSAQRKGAAATKVKTQYNIRPTQSVGHKPAGNNGGSRGCHRGA